MGCMTAGVRCLSLNGWVYSTSLLCFCYFVFFFFSSRRRHTRFDCDWSSDVCSSDLVVGVADEIKGEIPLGLIVLKVGVQRPADAIADELVARVRERIGPVAAFRKEIGRASCRERV